MKQIKYYLVSLLLLISVTLYAQIEKEQPNNEGPTVGLVLSGGGAKGFAYVGLLKVLEEVNMPIDYIGGSSIGAITAGLYSIGYSPTAIENIIREQDWTEVISDIQDRQYQAYEEKLFSDKYIFTIPIQDSSISLSQSVSTSFNIDLMLNRYFAPSAHLTDFAQLPIPFLCIGTDLITGEDVVLDSGNLARAVRASMAIPGYFSPIYYQGRYLIDGGVVNNYPAQQVKEKGMDIIIGGDVQSGLKSNIKDLNSVTSILDQVISFNRVSANNIGTELTDYMVKIKLPYGMMDFDMYDSIIAYGEKVAREHYSELKHLADSINNLRSTPYNRKEIAINNSIKIDKVKWSGIGLKHEEKFKGYFEVLEGETSSFDEIEERMKLLNGSKSYDDLYYVLSADTDEQNTLKVIADKPSIGSLAAGLHYDNIYLGSALINFSFRNINKGRSKLFTDIVLGQNPRLNAMYIINNGFKPGFGLETDMFLFSFPQYNNRTKINSWKFDYLNTSAFMPLTIKNNFLFKAGFQYELFRFEQDVVIDTSLAAYNEFSDYGNIFASINLDTRDKVYFTESGQLIELKLKHVFPFSQKWSEFISNSTIIYLKYLQSLPLNEKLVFNPGLFMGYTFIKSDITVTPFENSIESNSPVQHLFGFGGLNPNNYIENHVPFTGLRFMEKLGQYACVLSADFQYNFYDKLYLTAMADAGFNEMKFKDVNIKSILLGAGLKLSYNSFIGPIEFSVMSSNTHQSLIGYLNMGFWF